MSNNELMHYGIKGMKWGVRRDKKRLSKAQTQKQRDKALTSLEKRRNKGAQELSKLKKKQGKLEKAATRATVKVEPKAKALKQDAAVARRRAYMGFKSQSKRAELMYKADKLDVQAEHLLATAEKAKAKVAANKKMQEMFETEIRNISSIVIADGYRYSTRPTDSEMAEFEAALKELEESGYA